MRLNHRHSLVATLLLVAALLAVGLTLVCADGAHPTMGAISNRCLSMTHTTVVGTDGSSDDVPVLAAELLSVVLGIGLTLIASRRSMPAASIGVSPYSPPDPLMGRLRI